MKKMRYFLILFFVTGWVMQLRVSAKHPYKPKIYTDPHFIMAYMIKYGCSRCHITQATQADRTHNPHYLNSFGMLVDQDKSVNPHGRGCPSTFFTIKSQAMKSKPSGTSKAEIALAKQDMRAYGCVKCHAITGKGHLAYNFTKFGEKMFRRQSGCIDIVTSLSKTKSK